MLLLLLMQNLLVLLGEVHNGLLESNPLERWQLLTGHVVVVVKNVGCHLLASAGVSSSNLASDIGEVSVDDIENVLGGKLAVTQE